MYTLKMAKESTDRPPDTVRDIKEEPFQKRQFQVETSKSVHTGEQEMVEVFRADWGGDGYGSIQRVRLSPTETMLAATVKKDHHEETRCMLVHLGGVNLHQNAMLVLDNVLSFGKIYYTLIVTESFLTEFFLHKCLLSCRMGRR